MTYKERVYQEKLDKRKAVFNMFLGRCAYCGCYLEGCFQIDHVIPKRRYKYTDHNLPIGTDHLSNLMPACTSCNSCKSDLSVEEFRERVADRVRRLNKYSSEYVIAKRFGLIMENNHKVLFYFEKIKQDIPHG